MADVWPIAKRSEVMGLIRSNGNAETELQFIKLLRKHHISGWRRRQPLLGKPDFVFPKERVAVFVDGCFWHGCPKCYRRPKSHQKYWDAKVARNRARDRFVSKELKKGGWSVVRFWHHQLANDKLVALRLAQALEKQP